MKLFKEASIVKLIRTDGDFTLFILFNSIVINLSIVFMLMQNSDVTINCLIVLLYNTNA